MTEETQPPFPHRGQLMEEAALWFARMRGPDAEEHRAEFEAWLARGALHRSAYNRAGEIFSLGKFLREEADASSTPDAGDDIETLVSEENPRRVRLLPITLAAACFVLLIAWALFASPVGGTFGTRDDIAGQPASEEVVSYASGAAETRTEHLADGSIVTLQPASVLTVTFSPTRRDLRLERGTARFDVAHEGRPFVLAAGGGTVTARGTVFEVRLAEDDRVTVRLLRGSVDVVMPASVHSKAAAKRLQPGQSVSYSVRAARDDDDERVSDAAPSPATTPAATMRSFDRARLVEVIAQANSGSVIRIRLADPVLGERLVSGQFRINDPQKLAERLAWIFDLRVRRDPGGDITLSER